MSEIKKISFDGGFQEIDVNGYIIRWNPNDIDFVDRFFRFTNYVENGLGKRINEISKDLDINKANGGLSYEDYKVGTFKALGEEFNAELDKAFNASVSGVFGGANPITPTGSGKFAFENFLEAITPIIEESVKQFESAREKYTTASRNRAERRAAAKRKKS